MTTPIQIISIDEAINRIKMGRFQLQVLFATGTCFMADSMQVMLLSFLTRLLQREWEFDETIASAITSCLFAGAMVGTLILGPAGDRVGRKPILIISAIIISVFGLATALCNNYMTIMAAILMVGFGIGGLTVPFDILAEFLTTEKRGKYLLLIKYFWTVGSCLIPLLAYVSIEIAASWRLFVVLCSLPSIFSFIISSCFVPESPRWLVSMGQKDKALEILRDAAKRNGVDVDKAFPEGIQLADEEKESSDFRELLSVRKLRVCLFCFLS
jgi:MFS family permease